MFFAQNAGATDAGTGANKSAIIQKISLAQAARAASPGIQNNTGVVEVQTVNTNPPVINPNGEQTLAVWSVLSCQAGQTTVAS